MLASVVPTRRCRHRVRAWVARLRALLPHGVNVPGPLDEFLAMARDQVSAIVEAEIALDPARASKHEETLLRCRVRPRLLGCQRHPDPSPGGLVPLWLVLEEPPDRGDRYFIAFDSEAGAFGIGIYEGQRAWYLETCEGFFAAVERL